MRSHHLVIGFASACLLGLCLYFVPQGEERASMLARDGYSESALETLERLYNAGNREPHILMQLYKLRDQLGRPQEAAEALTEYLAASPSDLQANELLATLYLNTLQTSKAIAVYEKLNSLQPSNAHYVKALLSLYPKNGSYEQELKLLKNAPENVLEAEDLYRLGTLLAGDRDLNSAIEALIKADKKAPLQEKGSPYEKEFRLTLFNLLLETAQPARAVAMAGKWCNAWKSDYYLQTFAKRLVELAPASVLEFAKLTAQIPDAQLQIAQVVTASARPDLTAEVLIQWAPQMVNATPERIRDFIYLASLSTDSALPIRVLDDFMEEGVKPDVIANLADEIAKHAGMASLSSLKSQLSYEVLRAKPLFGARFSYATGNPMLARDLAFSLNPQALREEDLVEWLELLTALGGREAAFTHLTALKASGTISDDAYVAIASLVAVQSAEDARRAAR